MTRKQDREAVDLDKGTNPGKTHGKLSTKEKRARTAKRRAKRWREKLAAGLTPKKPRPSRAKAGHILKPMEDVIAARGMCGTWSAPTVLVSTNLSSQEVRIQPAKCKGRGCGKCDRCKAAKLKQRAAPHFTHALLITYTLLGEAHKLPREEAIEHIRACWTTFWDAICRAYPFLRSVPWVKAMEPHKSGTPHIHQVLSLRGFSVQVLQRFWTAAGGGNVDLQWRPITSAQGALRAVWYALKYVAKGGAWGDELIAWMREKGIRLYSMSRRIPPTKVEIPDGWTIWTIRTHWVRKLVHSFNQANVEVREGTPWTAPTADYPHAGGELELFQDALLEDYGAGKRKARPIPAGPRELPDWIKHCADWARVPSR